VDEFDSELLVEGLLTSPGIDDMTERLAKEAKDDSTPPAPMLLFLFNELPWKLDPPSN
jgi:hypothetical protein